jgi:hypothetical protein
MNDRRQEESTISRGIGLHMKVLGYLSGVFAVAALMPSLPSLSL